MLIKEEPQLSFDAIPFLKFPCKPDHLVMLLEKAMDIRYPTDIRLAYAPFPLTSLGAQCFSPPRPEPFTPIGLSLARGLVQSIFSSAGADHPNGPLQSLLHCAR